MAGAVVCSGGGSFAAGIANGEDAVGEGGGGGLKNFGGGGLVDGWG